MATIAAVIAPFARRSVAAEIAPDRVAWFYTMYLLSLTGLLGIAITGDAFNAFVFLEISSLSSYALIGLGRDRRALVAAYQYLILGTIGATFYVIGVGLLYVSTGTLNLGLMAERIVAVEQTRPVLAALAFITVGISLKLALFPLHVWLPNAYAYAPSTATVFLAATATKVAIYLLVRYLFSVFGAGFVFADLPVTPIFMVLSIARDLHRRDRRRLPVRRQAPVRLFLGGADRLHHPRHRARHHDQPDRQHHPHRQPRADQGRPVHGARRDHVPRRHGARSRSSPASAAPCR